MTKPPGDTAEIEINDVAAAEYYLDSPPTVAVAVGGVSHRGMVRADNQDHFIVVRRRRLREVVMTNLPASSLPAADDEAYALVVADGMGGLAGGELASRLALQFAWKLGGREIKWTLKLSDREIEDLKEKAELFFQIVNRKLIDYALEHPEVKKMGTTLTIAYTVGPTAFIMHAGDSRAYLLRQGQLHRLTRDHTLAEDIADAGYVGDAQRLDAYRHVLTNCIGGGDHAVRADISHVSLADEDLLLLCTDGLTKHVTDDEITGLLPRDGAPQAGCDALLQLALERGGRDNITIVAARYGVPRQQDTATDIGR